MQGYDGPLCDVRLNFVMLDFDVTPKYMMCVRSVERDDKLKFVTGYDEMDTN